MSLFDFHPLDDRNKNFKTKLVRVANGSIFRVLDIGKNDALSAFGLLYVHVLRSSRRCYIGITQMRARHRWHRTAYRFQRVFWAAIKTYGWGAFDSYVVALCQDRDLLLDAEMMAIAAAGGHRSKFTFNSSPGGEIVAENDKALIGVCLLDGRVVHFKSGSQAARVLGLSVSDGPTAVARGERSSVAGWWFRFAEQRSEPPTIWGEQLRVQRVRELQGKKVIAIHTVTRDVRIFSTTAEAASQLRVEQSAVSMVARGLGHSARGWWFKFAGDPREIPLAFGSVATREKRDREVYATNLSTGEKKQFRNSSVADRHLGLHLGASASVASGSRTSAGNWWFSYISDEAPPTLFKGALVAMARSKPVIATRVATGERYQFLNGKTASEVLGVHRSAISQILRGKRTVSCGFTFSEPFS